MPAAWHWLPILAPSTLVRPIATPPVCLPRSRHRQREDESASLPDDTLDPDTSGVGFDLDALTTALHFHWGEVVVPLRIEAER